MRRRTGLACLAALGAVSCSTQPSGPADDGGKPIRGITFVSWESTGYSRPGAGPSFDRLAATGATSTAILVTAYQGAPGSSVVAADPDRTPTAASVREALLRARDSGLHAALKPTVDVVDGSWRAGIDPGDPDAWFASYAAWILPLADLGEAWGARLFVVGTELAGTLQYEDRWRALIAEVRARFSGELTYAASWDEAANVPFWDALDAVGIDFYYAVTRRTDAGRSEMLAGWQPWLARLSALHERTGRPVLLTEIGYRSVDGAGLRPYAFEGEADIDLGEQADLYWAALTALGSASWIEGMYWWNWLADGHGGPHDDDYTPLGKDAELVLQEAWR